MGVNGYTIFGFEIQHIIPQEFFDEFGTKLAALGIKKDSVGNVMALLSNAETAEAFKNAPPEVQDAMRAAGWGFGSHDAWLGRQGDKNHRAYSDFIGDELRAAFDLSDPEQSRLQALDVIRFATAVSRGDFLDITIHNADPAAMKARFNETRLAPDFVAQPDATPSQTAIDSEL